MVPVHAAQYNHLGNLKPLMPKSYHETIISERVTVGALAVKGLEFSLEFRFLKTADLRASDLPLRSYTDQLNKNHCASISRIVLLL